MSVRRAVKARLLTRPFTLGINLLTIAALARLLSPAEFGAFAIAAVVQQIALALGAFGVRAQLLRAPTLEQADHRAGVGLTLTLCSILSIAMISAPLILPSGLITDGVGLCLVLLAPGLLLTPISVAQEVPLVRRMEFGLLTAASVGQAAIRAVIAIPCAFLGLGAASLAAGALAERALPAVVLAIARRSGRFPLPKFSGWAVFLRDGARISATDLVWRLGDAVVIGGLTSLLGMAAVGLYNRADRVVRLFDTAVLESLKPIALPAISRAVNRGDDPAEIYLMKVDYLASLGWPAFAMIAVLAEPLCLVLLGPSWGDAATVVQALALIGLGKPFTKMSQSMLIVLDRAGEALRHQALHHATRATLAVLGASVSLEAAGVGLAVAHLAHAARLSTAFKRATNYDAGTLMRLAARAAAIAGAAGLAAAYGAAMSSTPILSLVFGGAAGCAAWASAALVMKHPLIGEALLALGARRAASRFGVDRGLVRSRAKKAAVGLTGSASE